MPSFASSAQRLLRQLLGGPPRLQGPYAGTQTMLDGNSAVAVTEASISEGAGLGGSFPADTAILAWRTEQQRLGTNLMGSALISLPTEGPRGALAAASGLALSGIRATAFLSGPDLAGVQDLLTSAAGRHLPLVLHLSNRALAGQAATLGSGHEALHLSADAGCFLLFAANVQEAVDFTLIARRVAEQALVPGLVVMDGEQTALAAQEVRLPPATLVERFIGAPQDSIPAPTPAQRLLFGEHRRRVPRWHDLDRPVLLGALQPSASWGLGKISDRLFMGGQGVDDTLKESLRLFAEHTGRRHRRVSVYRMDDAELVLMAQGAAVETAEAVADRLRGTVKLKVGVLGLRSLRPFPGGRIAEHLGRGQRVCVMERMDNPLAGDPPLLREVRAALDRALENGRFGAQIHPGYPSLGESDRPHLLSVIYGLGGLPLRGGDLVGLCTQAHGIERPRVYLGIDLARATSLYPKRQVLLDSLRRSYPDISGLGLAGGQDLTDLRPEGAITLAVHRISGQGGEGLALEAASLLMRVSGGQLRGRPALFGEPWGGYCIDLFTSAPEGLKDPGDAVPVDLAVLALGAGGLAPDSLRDLTSDGVILMAGPETATGPSADQVRALRESGARLYGVPAFDPGAHGLEVSPGLANDYLLGAVFGVMLDAGLLEAKPRRLTSVREETLEYLPEAVRTARLDSFNAGLGAVQGLDPATLQAAPGGTRSSVDEAPMVVRELGNIDDTYDSLPRFWDQVGVLYRQGETAEMAPDPYLAIGAIPPRSSAFRDLSPLRGSLPVLDPLACTGCGACWSRCPDAAIGAAALGPVALLNAGIQTTGGDALRPLVSKLGARIAALCARSDSQTRTAGALLEEAFGWLQGKMTLPAGRKQDMRAACDRLQTQIGCLPVAVTEAFFQQPEGRSKGSGELLFLAVNPDACKGCGICVSACEPSALTFAEQTPETLAQARGQWRAWEQLPETRRGTIERVADLPEVGAMAAVLLSRRTAQSLVGGDGAEPGSGERLALRLALATHEYRQQPLIDAFAQEVQAIREEIAGLIREALTDALPADDLDALARGLETVDSPRTDLNAFLAEAQGVVGGGIDAIRMGRLVGLAQGLGELAYRLADGRQGVGRAKLGVVLSSETVSGWAGVFPNNPFCSPVALDLTGDGAQLAAGLLEGQLRQAAGGFILMRKARLELESAADAARLSSGLDGLTWRDLTPEERALCPSMLLVGGAGVPGRRGLSEMEWMLGTELPIRMLLLADLDLGLTTRAAMGVRPAAMADPGIDLALLALARRGAWVAQSSLAASGHLLQSLDAAFGFQGPALLHLHAPSPARHGFAPERTIEQARLALDGRLLPLFIYDPRGEGVFGSRLSLEGNPEPLAAWVDRGAGGVATPASWALSEGRFAAYFSPLDVDAPAPLPLIDYLSLDASTRGLKTPFVEAPGADGTPLRFQVDGLLVKACEERLQGWRALQELAGLVTPFTARVEARAREAVAVAHAAELAAMEAGYETRIADLRKEMLEDTREEVRERLLALAGYSARGTDQRAGTQ